METGVNCFLDMKGKVTMSEIMQLQKILNKKLNGKIRNLVRTRVEKKVDSGEYRV